MIFIREVKWKDSLSKRDNNSILHKEAHELLRENLLKYYINDEKDILYKRNEYGKLEVINSSYNINLSYCKGMVCCGILKFNNIGIDVEYVRKYNKSLLNLVLSNDEKIDLMKAKDENEYFFRLWTLKESYIKAIGKGLSFPMKKCNFKITQDEIITNIKGYKFKQKLITKDSEKYIISIAWEGNYELVL